MKRRQLRKRFIVGSLVMHAALLGLASRPSLRAPEPSRAGEAKPAPEVEIEVDAQALSATEPDAAPLAPRATKVRASASTPPAANQANGDTENLADPTGEPAADLVAEAAPEGADGPDSDGADGDGVAEPGPRLSLTDLGVGDRNPFFDRKTPQKKAEQKARAVKRRLDRALAQGLLDGDRAKGRGAGSPVMRALEAATYASTVVNGNASFTLIIDSDGKLVSGSLGAVSSDREAWERVARQALRDLAGRKLQVPKGSSGVRLTVNVTSRVELPSGADPGLEVRAFGVPLKRGQGERSPRVDILNPLSPGSPLSVVGDPADIGATARRMVRAHVVSEELL